MDKENAAPIQAMAGTPPPLVPMTKARKSSSKKVRFSIDSEAESPIRLNRDVPPEDIAGSRLSVASRRSSGAADSPLHFPSQEELLGGLDALESGSRPSGSPSDSRQSTGSVLTSALGSFTTIAQPTRSIWDTPSSATFSASPTRKSIVAKTPSRLSAETPSKAEQRMFGFHVLSEVASSEQPTVHEDREGSPITVPQQDDPMLMSGASSAVRHRMGHSASSFGSDLATPSTGKSRSGKRRRRLSHIEDMESELLNASSPERPAEAATAASALRKAGIDLDSLTSMARIDLVSLLQTQVVAETSSWDDVSDPQVVGIALQMQKSIELTRDSAIHSLAEEIEAKRAELWSLMVRAETAPVPDANEMKRLSGEASSIGKECVIQILENEIENAGQTTAALQRLSEEATVKSEQLADIQQEAESLSVSIAEMKSELETQFTSKFSVLPNGSVERIKTATELRFEQLDAFVKTKEAAISAVIEDITELEATIAERQCEYTNTFSRMRQFYLDHGWNVVADLRNQLVVVYGVCHLFVFEKAKNSDRFWRLDRILPADFDVPPHYAPNIDSEQVSFSSDLVLEQLADCYGLKTAFECSAQNVHDLMASATAALCEWVELRESLASALPTPESRVKINSNMQIEAAIVVPNEAVGVEVPLTVKLMWFDPLFATDKVNYTNCSYLLPDSLLKYFPGVRDVIEERLAKLRTDPHSLAAFAEVVKVITSALVNAHPAPSYA